MMTIQSKPYYNPGDIVLIPFPFAEKDEDKQRTAVIISTASFNQQSPGVICVKISKTKSDHSSIISLIGYQKDLCGLDADSYIYSTQISTISKSLIVGFYGSLPPTIKRELMGKIRQYIGV